MKSIKLVLCLTPFLIAQVSCEKCFECTGDIPVFFNGQQVSSTEITQDFCDNGPTAKAQKEAYEEEGYVCVEQ